MADVHVLHLLHEDQREPTGLRPVLLGQDERVEAGWEAAPLCLSAELETLRQAESGQSLWVEVAPLRDVRVVVEDPGFVRSLQRVELLGQTFPQPGLRLIRLEAKVEIQPADNEVTDKPFVLLKLSHCLTEQGSISISSVRRDSDLSLLSIFPPNILSRHHHPPCC